MFNTREIHAFRTLEKKKRSTGIFRVTLSRNVRISQFERSHMFTRETHVMSVLIVRDALPVQRTAKSKQKCETVARGSKDERTPPASSLTSFPNLTVVFSSRGLLFSSASGAFTEGNGKGKLSCQVASALCPRLLVKRRPSS